MREFQKSQPSVLQNYEKNIPNRQDGTA